MLLHFDNTIQKLLPKDAGPNASAAPADGDGGLTKDRCWPKEDVHVFISPAALGQKRTLREPTCTVGEPRRPSSSPL